MLSNTRGPFVNCTHCEKDKDILSKLMTVNLSCGRHAGAAGNMQPGDLELWKQRSGWFHQSGSDVCTTPFSWRNVYCENQSSHSSCKRNHLLWGAERRGSTFHGLWSSSPLHQAEPQPETGLDRWVFPVGPWLDGGLLDTTGTGLRTPASLVLEETGLCFWRRPCGRRGIAEAWVRSAAVRAGPVMGEGVSAIWDISLVRDSVRSRQHKLIPLFLRFLKTLGLKSTLGSHKTTKRTDLLIEPEEMSMKG